MSVAVQDVKFLIEDFEDEVFPYRLGLKSGAIKKLSLTEGLSMQKIFNKQLEDIEKIEGKNTVGQSVEKKLIT